MDCVEDAKSAMRWVRANAGKLGVDPDCIAAGGGSAGGYLSAATLLIEFANAVTDPAGVSAKPNAIRKTGNRCELVACEGEGHSFFNKDKYFALTIAETDKFLVRIGWLEKNPGAR